ncbi:MAG: FKBP-type peptidyl-prolyl cis-trans isomerase N-terminal domain-containing protein [Lysobacteraceae bacterium]
MTMRLFAAESILLAVVVATAVLPASAHAQDSGKGKDMVSREVMTEKGKLSYSIGYDLANGIRRQRVDVDTAALNRGISDALASKPPLVPKKQMDVLLAAMQQKFLSRARTAYEKAFADNKARSEQFSTQYKAKPGVKTLPDGIAYRVIDEGSGSSPTADSQVRISFRGMLADGTPFADTSKGGDAQHGIAVDVSDSPLPGLKEVLTMMKPGAHWEVLLPSDQAYGDSPRSPVGPAQVVMFDLILVEVVK